MPFLAIKICLLRYRIYGKGERVSAKNNLPIASKIPEAKNIYCIGGLGSRGLSYAPFLAEIVSSAIQDKQIPLGKEIFTLLNI